MIAPESLKSIIERVGNRFRFRNVLSMDDYFSCQQDGGGLFVCVNLDNRTCVHLDINQCRYALLSSEAEIEFLKTLKSQTSLDTAGSNYGKY